MEAKLLHDASILLRRYVPFHIETFRTSVFRSGKMTLLAWCFEHLRLGVAVLDDPLRGDL